jgi:hypothetical protein
VEVSLFYTKRPSGGIIVLYKKTLWKYHCFIQKDIVEVSLFYTKRPSGGIIVLYKKELTLGITYIQNGTKSENRLWLKLDKKVFGLESDLYICAVYISPASSTHFDNDIVKLENEISIFANRGKILLIWGFLLSHWS